jgi:hypothetical protein
MVNTSNFLGEENIFSVKEKYKISIIEINKYLGLTIIQFLSILFILTQIAFYFGIGVNFGSFIVTVLITFLILFLSVFFDYKKNNETDNVIRSAMLVSLIVSVIFAIAFVISIGFGNIFIDQSFDSNAYHKPYSLFFVNGWNPIMSNTPPDLFEGKIKGNDHKKNSYPKASEMIASYIYLLSDSLESVKAINLIILFSAFAITLFTILLFLPYNRIAAITVSFVAVLNPVWIAQSTEFFIDGFTSELILILICLILIYINGNNNWYILLSLLLDSVLLLSTKGSSLLFIPLFMVMLVTLVWLFCRHQMSNVIIFLVILMGISLITGFSPYMENYKNYKSPLGEDIGSPEGFTQFYTGYTNNLLPGWAVPRELFIKSLFSSPSQKYYGMKNPFSFQLTELDNLTGENRINGYGPLCGITILVSLILLLLLIPNIKNRDTTILLICILFIFLTVILHPACWWARFVPQFFLIPVFIGVCGYINGSFLSKSLSSLLLILMILNIGLVGYHSYSVSYMTTKDFERGLSNIRDNAQFPVGLNNSYSLYSQFYPELASPVSAVLLEERGIPWGICGKTMNCSYMKNKKQLIFYTDVLFRANYQIGDTIDFSKKGNSDLYTTSGWSWKEQNSTWTDGNESEINLVIKDKIPENVFFNFKGTPFVKNGIYKPILQIEINNKTLYGPKIISDDLNMTLPIPAGYLVTGTNVIKIKIPEAKSPKSLGLWEDNRKIGIAVNSISLMTSVPNE